MSQQLSLSLELILLLEWFLKNGTQQLRFLVQEAVKKDLARDLERMNDRDYVKMLDSLHDTMIDFIVFLEDALLEGLEEVDCAPVSLDLHGLDKHSLDSKTLWLSIQQMRKKRALSEQEVRQEFFRKLLKNWKPASNESVN